MSGTPGLAACWDWPADVTTGTEVVITEGSTKEYCSTITGFNIAG